MAVRKEDIDAMPTIEPELRWIPCDEKLQEKPDIYMVTDTNGNVVRFIFDKTESSRDRMAEVGARLDSIIRNAQNGATIEEIISDLKELQSEVW